MIREPDIAQVAYHHMTKDLFLTSQGRLRHRVIAENVARELMTMLRAEREMLDRRRSRIVSVTRKEPVHADRG